MKPNLLKPLLFPALCIVLLGFDLVQAPRHVAAQNETATPTYDPLVEPPLSSNPTELELGQNLYWHWCMTCHGDRGQGLTDEFRGVWPEDHQNCWAKGCHAGRKNDFGFPIPTVVPAIVDESRLSKFPSLQVFTAYLQATHPPQSPGVLKDEEYDAIAIFVFTMNGRGAKAAVPVSTPTTTLSLLPSPTATGGLASVTWSADGPGSRLGGVILFAVASVILFFMLTAVAGWRRGEK